MGAISFSLRDARQMRYYGLLNSFLQAFRRATGNLSGPGAELFLRLLISSSIICSLKLMSVSVGRADSFKSKKDIGSEIADSGSFVEKTDEY